MKIKSFVMFNFLTLMAASPSFAGNGARESKSAAEIKIDSLLAEVAADRLAIKTLLEENAISAGFVESASRGQRAYTVAAVGWTGITAYGMAKASVAFKGPGGTKSRLLLSIGTLASLGLTSIFYNKVSDETATEKEYLRQMLVTTAKINEVYSELIKKELFLQSLKAQLQVAE